LAQVMPGQQAGVALARADHLVPGRGGVLLQSNPLDYTNWLIERNGICGNNYFRKGHPIAEVPETSRRISPVPRFS